MTFYRCTACGSYETEEVEIFETMIKEGDYRRRRRIAVRKSGALWYAECTERRGIVEPGVTAEGACLALKAKLTF